MEYSIKIKDCEILFKYNQSSLKIAGGYLNGFKILSSPLFNAKLKNLESKEEILISSLSNWDSVNILNDKTFRFSSPNGIKNLTVEFNIIIEEFGVKFLGEVINENPTYTVMEIDYPSPTLENDNYDLFIPMASGLEIKNANLRDYNFNAIYPSSHACMQYFAVYDKIRGVYLGVEDGDGAIKNFNVNSKNKVTSFKLTCFAPNAGKSKNSFKMYGALNLQIFNGDWYEASMIYSNFVTKSAKWLPKTTKKGRNDTPQKFKDVALWIADSLLNYPSQGENGPTSLLSGNDKYDKNYWVDVAIELKKQLNVPIAYHVYNWHQIPFNVEYPHFLPAKPEFIEGAKNLRDNGILVVPYINSVSWETKDHLGGYQENFENVGRLGSVLNEDGSIQIVNYPQTDKNGEKVQLAPMCPSYEKWQDIICDLTTKMHETLPIDGIYFDEIAAHKARLCYDKSHGHTLGGGTYWVDGYNSLMDKVIKNKPLNAYYFTECNAEPYMKSFNGFLTWWWVYNEQVPAFSTVYSGFIEFVGRFTVGKKKDDFEFFKYNTAQSLHYGQQIGWFKPDVVYNVEAMKFLKPIVTLKHKYSWLFANGKMLKPPKVFSNLPSKKSSPALHFIDEVVTTQVSSSLWQSKETGKKVLFLTNISKEQAEIELSFNSKKTNLPKDFIYKDSKYYYKSIIEPYACIAWEFNDVNEI